MPKTRKRMEFPDPREAGPDGLVALGGDLEPDTLLEAYRNGIFPWPIEKVPVLTWFSPDERGVLFFEDLHVSRSLERALKKKPFELTVNKAFEEVIGRCASVPRKPRGTWLTPPMIDAYVTMHRLGHAHSVEAWKDGKLVGGVYGLEVDGMFSAESMFRLEDNASKVALLHLIEILKKAGAEWVDVQVLSTHVESLGGRSIPREEYLDLIQKSRKPRKRLIKG